MEQNFDKIRRLSADIRIQTTMAIGTAGFGHIGGAASIADVLAVLYGGMMRIDPKRPDWSERDWMILSKGHCGPALYATLALAGYFPMEWYYQSAWNPTAQPCRLPEDTWCGHDYRFSGAGNFLCGGYCLGKPSSGKGQLGLLYRR